MWRHSVVRVGPAAFCLTLLTGGGVPAAAGGMQASGRSSGFVTVASVSCASAGNCAAGGSSALTPYVLSEDHGVWGRPRAVAGNLGPALIAAVSCGSAGNCVAGGTVFTNTGESFVVEEVHGAWRRALPVGGGTNFNAVSCGSAGNCVAGGQQLISEGSFVGLVVSEVNGRWGPPMDPGFDSNFSATISSVSCSSAGNCAVAGNGDSPFLMIERDGRWGSSFRVAGNLNGSLVTLTSVSCAAKGNCAAGGYYQDAAGKFQGFLVSEANGHRGNAITIPINRTGRAPQVTVPVSCGAPGNCAAGGSYTDAAGNVQGFVMNEVNGRWGTLKPVPGLRPLNTSGVAYITSISCTTAGNCVAGGAFTTSSATHAFVVSERNGRWGKAIAVRGLAGRSTVTSVSCGSPGNCAAAGPRFVASESAGRWHKAILVRRPA